MTSQHFPVTIHFLYITLDFCPDVGPDPYRYWPRHSSTELLTFFTGEDPILNDVNFLVAQLRWNLIEFDERNLPADREHRTGGWREILRDAVLDGKVREDIHPTVEDIISDIEKEHAEEMERRKWEYDGCRAEVLRWQAKTGRRLAVPGREK
ncbi:hypothetical protein QC763_0058880 [Podospora pseudopauciseta]|uniref:Uncharacterized protein n=1 Tax=Podospora pseudopauciseta TaxID=2093780 RepID=A0ABR0HHN0_9PEZI|nr:hypothetical protein QC763_0058880 [Podospora pseudopauciseta]